MRKIVTSSRTFILACLAACCVCVATVPSASAQNSIWKGGAGNWSDNNWNGGVPTAASNVFIDGGKNIVSTVTVDITNAVGATLTLDSDDTLAFDSIGALSLSGSVALNGTTNLNLGTLTLNGPSTNSGTISMSTDSVTFAGHHLILDDRCQYLGYERL
jgi:hypothetical protein